MPPCSCSAITRIKSLFGKLPKAVTADRGYGEARIETELEALGVKHVAIPRRGRPGPKRRELESSRRFRKLVKWRTGSEGRISHLKHSWGWERTVLDNIDGARTWCGWGVLAHNATKIAVLIEDQQTRPKYGIETTPAHRGPRRTSEPPSTNASKNVTA